MIQSVSLRRKSNVNLNKRGKSIKDKKLVIEIDLEAPHPSRSGKTLIVASTYGSFKSDVKVEGKPVNAYINK